MSPKIRAEQLSEAVMAGLNQLSNTTSQGVKAAVEKAGKTVKEQIRAGAPTRSGTYKQSWAVKKTAENANSLQVTVHSRNRYQLAHLLEHGHAKRGGGRTRALSHIAPAEALGEQQLIQDIERMISRG